MAPAPFAKQKHENRKKESLKENKRMAGLETTWE